MSRLPAVVVNGNATSKWKLIKIGEAAGSENRADM
jgi:hypothetical protein